MMKKSKIREMIITMLNELTEEDFNGYDASGHVEDLGWYPKSLEEFEKEYNIKEVSANTDGVTNYDIHPEDGREKLKREVFGNQVDALVKLITKYVNKKFSDEVRNKKLMKLMQSDLGKITRMIDDWKRAR